MYPARTPNRRSRKLVANRSKGLASKPRTLLLGSNQTNLRGGGLQPMTPREQSGSAAPAKRDHRQEVTDSIVQMLEDGVAPWQKPWEAAGMPFNPTTDKAYRGGNAVHLMATGLSRGYEDPRWMTYNQAAEKGWQVRKGEKGTHIEFWEVKAKPEERNGEPSKNGGDETAKENRRRLIHRVYTVFNAKQIDGVPAFERRQPTAFEAVQAGERILAEFRRENRSRPARQRVLSSVHRQHPPASERSLQRRAGLLRHGASRTRALDRSRLPAESLDPERILPIRRSQLRERRTSCRIGERLHCCRSRSAP